MNHYIHEIKNLVEKINENHKHHLEELSESVLLKVNFPDSNTAYIKIDKNGLEFVSSDKEKTEKNQITITYKDLKKILDNPVNIIRFLATGRVKIKGNIREILQILEKI